MLGAFAAVLGDRTVFTWGHPQSGGDSREVQDRMSRRTKEELEGTDAVVKRHYQLGEHTTAEKVRKINRQLVSANLPEIKDWDSYKRAYLKRVRKNKLKKVKSRKSKYLKEATSFITSIGGAAVALACYIVSRQCVSELSVDADPEKCPLRMKGGKLHKALPAFLGFRCMKALRLVHRDAERCKNWRARWGYLEKENPTVQQLFSLCQLHPVQSEPDIEAEFMHMVSDNLLGACVLIQARMRGPELKQWLEDHALGVEDDGGGWAVTHIDREHFRQTWTVPCRTFVFPFDG